LITGASRGLGAAIAQALAASGHAIILNYLSNREAAEGVKAQIEKAGGEVELAPFDVGDASASGAAIARLLEDPRPISVLVNNAGITRDAMLHKMTAEQWREVIDVDLGGCFNMCRSVIEGMRERRFGRIVNISSVNALSGQAGQTNYAAAKAGMIGLTKSLALEGAARNITVNAIAPGYTDTAMVSAVAPQVLEQILKSVPAGRLATPAEVARGVVFLAADDAGFVNGITLSINGGKYLP
jgi:acetoacetyl-CoA reductase